jgi:hypothetical protein
MWGAGNRAPHPGGQACPPHPRLASIRRLPPLPVSPALAELWEREGILEDILEGRGLRFDSRPAPPGQVAQPLYIPPFDTSSFIDPPAREHELGLDETQLEEQPAEHPPARRRPWRRSG